MNNKRKKKYYLTMLGLATSLSVMGCQKNQKNYGNQMTKDDIKEYINSIDVVSDNKISYEVVSRMQTLTIRTNDEINTYLVMLPYSGRISPVYFDYFTGARLSYYFPEESYVNDMIYWLQEYNLIKESYTDEELKELINIVNYSYNDRFNKKLRLKKGDSNE